MTLNTRARAWRCPMPSTSDPGVEDRVEQERRVGGLGRDPRHPGDVDVRAVDAVEEVRVEEDRPARTVQARRQPPLRGDLVEEERAVPGRPRDAVHVATRQRRHEHLGLDPGRHDGRDLRRLAVHLPLHDAVDVGVVLDPLVEAPHLGDDPVEVDRHRHTADARHLPPHGDDVVELQQPTVDHVHLELQGRRRLRADDAAGGLRRGGYLHGRTVRPACDIPRQASPAFVDCRRRSEMGSVGEERWSSSWPSSPSSTSR